MFRSNMNMIVDWAVSTKNQSTNRPIHQYINTSIHQALIVRLWCKPKQVKRDGYSQVGSCQVRQSLDRSCRRGDVRDDSVESISGREDHRGEFHHGQGRPLFDNCPSSWFKHHFVFSKERYLRYKISAIINRYKRT